MKLFVNDRELTVENDFFLGADTYDEVLAAVVNSDLVVGGDVVTKLEVDGVSFEPGDEEMADKPVDMAAVGVVKVTKRLTIDLLMESIGEGVKSCRFISEESKRIAQLFRGQRLADANEAYANLIADIQDTIFYLSQLKEYILNLLEEAGDESFLKISKRFQDVAEETISFQEEADWVMLADLLEYEFSEIFSDFADYFQEFLANSCSQ